MKCCSGFRVKDHGADNSPVLPSLSEVQRSEEEGAISGIWSSGSGKLGSFYCTDNVQVFTKDLENICLFDKSDDSHPWGAEEELVGRRYRDFESTSAGG